MTESNVETFSEELSQVLQDIVTAPEEVKRAVLLDDETVLIDDVQYKVIENFREGFNIEALNERYNDIFERYDFIVGDWGHEKLRLKGFFKHSHKLATPDRDIDYLSEYILEYCNFGCPYFVVRRLSPNEFIEEIDDKEDIIDKLHDVKIQPTIQDTEKHTQAIDQ